jgi:hypothetical protein
MGGGLHLFHCVFQKIVNRDYKNENRHLTKQITWQIGTKFQSESDTLNFLAPIRLNMDSVMYGQFSFLNTPTYEIVPRFKMNCL